MMNDEKKEKKEKKDDEINSVASEHLTSGGGSASQSSDSLSLKPAMMAEFGSWSSSGSVESVNGSWSSNSHYHYNTSFSPNVSEEEENNNDNGEDELSKFGRHQCKHSASKAPVILPHIAVISIKEGGLKKDNEKDEQPASTTYQIISSHPQPFTPCFKKGVWSELSKTHDDYEVPHYFAEVMQQMNFQLGAAIGSGTFGKVYLATYTCNETSAESAKTTAAAAVTPSTFTSWEKKNQAYAVKVMDTSRLSEKYKKFFLLRELWALRSLPPHPNICRMYHLFTINEVERGSSGGVTSNNNKIITMIMEHCANGDVYEYVKKRPPLPERLARRWFAQLLTAVSHLHQQGIAHRDLKCENLLLDENFNLKLCDFGFCIDLTVCQQCETAAGTTDGGGRLLEESAASAGAGSSGGAGLEKRSLTFCGSTNYCSPELLQAEPYSVALNDVWACGVILYVWLFKAFPLSGEQLEQMETFQFDSISFDQEGPGATGATEQQEGQQQQKKKGQQQSEPLSADCLHVLKSIFQAEESRSSVAQLLSLPWVANCPTTTATTMSTSSSTSSAD